MLFAGAVCLGFGALAGGIFNRPPSRLTFLSVGQGDCAVLQTDGYTVLIDDGPKSEKFDAGRRLVLPKLRELGADSVDLILLSHPDSDHVGGTAALLAAFPHARIVMSDQYRTYPAMLDHLRSWQVSPDQVIWLPEAARLKVGDYLLTIHDPAYEGFTNDNEGSMFVHVQRGRASAVFSGDADMPAELQERNLEDWSSQILKVGHHGSRTSTSPEWLEEVKPQYAVISCGRDNIYGHPAKETLEKLSVAGPRIFRTDLQGDIEFDYDEKRGFVPQRLAVNASARS